MADWTDDRIAQLRFLWGKGLSYSQIANELGGVTRNAVIGKASRLGLPPRKDQFQSQRITRQRIDRSKKQRKRSLFPAYPVLEEHDDWKPRVVAAESLNLSLLDLAFGQCRYPTSETSPHFFCGQPQKKDSSFCLAHHAICHTYTRTYTPATSEKKAAFTRKNLTPRVYILQEAAE